MAEIKTRIALKYDSYANWAANSSLVLLKGELGICEIPVETKEVADTDSTSKVNTAPTVLFKVGDGKTEFGALPWASAKAADVYSWAKKSEEEFKTWLDTNAGFATDAELAAVKEALEAKDAGFESRIATLEANLGIDDGSEGSVQGQLTALDSRLDVLEGDGEGSVAKALADAEAYADTEVAGLKTTLEAADANLQTAINDEKTARENADNDINAKIGGAFTAESTVADAIAAAQTKANEAATAVSTLENGKVKANADAIAKEVEDREAAIEAVEGSISALDTAYKAADTELSGRLDSVEAWQDTIKNVMDFVGVSTTDPTGETAVTVEGITEFQKGDVVLYDGKEFVNITGTNEQGAWEEFGVGTATDAAVAALAGRMDTAEGAINDLEEAIDTKVSNDTFTTYQQTVAGTYETKENVSAAVQELTDNKLDASEFNTFKTGYEEKVAAIETEAAKHALKTDLEATDAKVKANEDNISALQGKVTALEETYTDAEVDSAIADAVASEKTRAEEAEGALDSRIDKYDAYFSTDAEGNLPDVLVFNCGGATAETLNAIN